MGAAGACSRAGGWGLVAQFPTPLKNGTAPVSIVIGLAIENGVLYAATYWFGWDTALQSNLFKAVGLAAATGFRFWVYRTWVFRRHGSSHPPEHSSPQSDFQKTRP
ncbi:hypothetical protein ACIA8I_38320 [Streptomyces rishiriensis]|uniref:hypothetical protein n=1 Tax=Streptomyces rishiriensis TaxID=68264 RepID=UPI003793AB96